MVRMLNRDVFPRCRHLVVASENRVQFPVEIFEDCDTEYKTRTGVFSKLTRRQVDDPKVTIIAGPFTAEGDLE